MSTLSQLWSLFPMATETRGPGILVGAGVGQGSRRGHNGPAKPSYGDRLDSAAKAEASRAGKCQKHNASVVSCFLWSPPVVCCPQGHCGNWALRDLPGWLSLSLFCVFLLGDNRGHFHPLDKAGDGRWLTAVTVRPLSIWAHEGCLGRNCSCTGSVPL